MANTLSSPIPAITWHGDCSIHSIVERKTELCALVATDPQAVSLDLSAVSRIDTTGLQLLAAFVFELAKRGASVRWVGASEAVSEAASATGLTGVLGLDSVA